MQIDSLPAGGAFGAAEIEVSLATAVNKAGKLALQARGNENDIICLMSVSFRDTVI